MTRRALSALVLGIVGLAPVFFPIGAVAGSARAHATSPAVVWSPATLVVSGHGWGHGVGLSQYGAYGYAQHGFTYDQIIAHYYPGTDLESAVPRSMRVLLASGKSLTISSTAPFRVTDGSGSQYDLADLSLTLDSSLTVNVAGGTSAVLTGPLQFTPQSSSTPLSYAGRTYRGTFSVSVVGSKLLLVNTVPLEQYLYGVVPCESPHDWPLDALEAQAIVARTYALATAKPESSNFDVYADTRSQVYHGITGEFPESTAAVNATTGKAVYYAGEVATTFFFSTSGGRTATIQDVWPKAQPEPYLVSVDDPYDDLSPYHNWGPLALKSETLAKKLKLPGPISDLTTVSNASERVSTATVTGASETAYEVSGDSVKQALNLRSTWFEVSVLALQRPAAALPYGTNVRVSGRARNAEAPSLETRPYAGSWTTVGSLSPDDAGLFSVVLRPRSTSFYRITSGDVQGALIRVPVAPRVRMVRTAGRGVRGGVKPFSGSPVVKLQRLTSSGWKAIGSLPLGSSGGFARAGVLLAGQYRARVTGLPGLSPGFSPVVVIA